MEEQPVWTTVKGRERADAIVANGLCQEGGDDLILGRQQWRVFSRGGRGSDGEYWKVRRRWLPADHDRMDNNCKFRGR